MKKGEVFVGFKEAHINFPPTFKYDVLRTLKKKHGPKRPPWKLSLDRVNNLIPEVEELDNDGAEDELDGEAASISSSTWSSASRLDTYGEDPEFLTTPPSSRSINTPGSRISFSIAASRAKAKWLALVSPISPRLGFRLQQDAGQRTPSSQPYTPLGSPHFLASPRTSSGPHLLTPNAEQSFQRPALLGRVNWTKSPHNVDEEEDDDKGVYDSSHKQRVPSW